MSTAEQDHGPGGLVWNGAMSVIIAVGIASVAVLQLSNAFTPGGLASTVAIPQSSGGGSTPSGDVLRVAQGTVTIPHPDAGLVALTICTILLAAIAGILVVAFYFSLTVEITRGRTFSRRAIRSLYAISAVVLIATAGCYMLDMALGRAVRAAAGLPSINADAPASYWMGFAIASGIGLVATAFRQGDRLQRETEGLV